MAKPWCCSDVSFSLAEGETLALLGRNGTGKTTLMDTLAGATRQHGGTHHGSAA
jgi:branched-chain amino acid transport system ATP-binding protein